MSDKLKTVTLKPLQCRLSDYHHDGIKAVQIALSELGYSAGRDTVYWALSEYFEDNWASSWLIEFDPKKVARELVEWYLEVQP